MSDAERANVLHALDLRYDQALEELAQLSQRIEAALGSLRRTAEPPSAGLRLKAVAG